MLNKTPNPRSFRAKPIEIEDSDSPTKTAASRRKPKSFVPKKRRGLKNGISELFVYFRVQKTKPDRYNLPVFGLDPSFGNRIRTYYEENASLYGGDDVPVTPRELLCEECEIRYASLRCEECDQVFCRRCEELCHQAEFDGTPHPHRDNESVRRITKGDKSRIQKPVEEFNLPAHYNMTEDEYMEITKKDLAKPNSLACSTRNDERPQKIESLMDAGPSLPNFALNEFVIFIDPTTKREAFGQVLSDFDVRHSVSETIVRGGSTLAGICYQVLMLGTLSRSHTKLEVQLSQLVALEEKRKNQIVKVDIATNTIDTSALKTVLELQDIPFRDRIKDAAVIDRTVRDIQLLQRVGWGKYREIKKNGVSNELPDGYNPEDKFINRDYVPAPADQPENYQRPPSSYILEVFKHSSVMDQLISLDQKVQKVFRAPVRRLPSIQRKSVSVTTSASNSEKGGTGRSYGAQDGRLQGVGDIHLVPADNDSHSEPHPQSKSKSQSQSQTQALHSDGSPIGRIIICTAKELQHPSKYYSDVINKAPQKILACLNKWQQREWFNMLQRAVEIWVKKVAYLRVEKQHLGALKIQTHFRRFRCRNILEEKFTVIANARRRKWRHLHRRLEYCPRDTPGCYSVDNKAFFRTLYHANRYVAFLKKTMEMIMMFVDRKRRILLRRYFERFVDNTLNAEAEKVTHFDDGCAEVLPKSDASLLEIFDDTIHDAHWQLQESLNKVDDFDQEEFDDAELMGEHDTGYHGKISVCLYKPEEEIIDAATLPLAVRRNYDVFLSHVGDGEHDEGEDDEGVDGDGTATEQSSAVSVSTYSSQKSNDTPVVSTRGGSVATSAPASSRTSARQSLRMSVKSRFKSDKGDDGADGEEEEEEFNLVVPPYHPSDGVVLPLLPRLLVPQAADERLFQSNIKRVGYQFRSYSEGPTDTSVWVIPGRVCIGTVPYGLAQRKGTMPAVTELLLSGCHTFVSVMEEEEEKQYAKKRKEKTVRSMMKPAFKKARYLCQSEVAEARTYVKEQKAIIKTLERVSKGDERYEKVQVEIMRRNARIRLAANRVAKGKANLKKLPKSHDWLRMALSTRPDSITPHDVLPMLWELEKRLSEGKNLFLYSNDIHGRVAVIAGCLLGRLYGLTVHNTMYRLQACHDACKTEQNRTYSITCPQHPAHRQLIADVLGLTNRPYEGVRYRSEPEIGTFGEQLRILKRGALQGVNGEVISPSKEMLMQAASFDTFAASLSFPESNNRLAPTVIPSAELGVLPDREVDRMIQWIRPKSPADYNIPPEAYVPPPKVGNPLFTSGQLSLTGAAEPVHNLTTAASFMSIESGPSIDGTGERTGLLTDANATSASSSAMVPASGLPLHPVPQSLTIQTQLLTSESGPLVPLLGDPYKTAIQNNVSSALALRTALDYQPLPLVMGYSSSSVPLAPLKLEPRAAAGLRGTLFNRLTSRTTHRDTANIHTGRSSIGGGTARSSRTGKHGHHGHHGGADTDTGRKGSFFSASAPLPGVDENASVSADSDAGATGPLGDAPGGIGVGGNEGDPNSTLGTGRRLGTAGSNRRAGTAGGKDDRGDDLEALAKMYQKDADKLAKLAANPKEQAAFFEKKLEAHRTALKDSRTYFDSLQRKATSAATGTGIGGLTTRGGMLTSKSRVSTPGMHSMRPTSSGSLGHRPGSVGGGLDSAAQGTSDTGAGVGAGTIATTIATARAAKDPSIRDIPIVVTGSTGTGGASASGRGGIAKSSQSIKSPTAALITAPQPSTDTGAGSGSDGSIGPSRFLTVTVKDAYGNLVKQRRVLPQSSRSGMLHRSLS